MSKNQYFIVDLPEMVSEILKILKPRSQEVIIRRFGLKTGKIETLESIGKRYQITRERVRQIEEFALRDLRLHFEKFEISNQISEVVDFIKECGNVCKEEFLFHELTGSSNYNRESANLTLSMVISNLFSRYNENDRFYSLWTFKDPQYLQTAKFVIDEFIKEFERIKRPVNTSEIPQIFNKIINESSYSEKAIFSYLSLSKQIGKNIFSQWGLINWPEIVPRGVGDKAYLILKRENKPNHFTKITELINKTEFGGKKANPQTVHNELIKDKRFVLVGRGIYALREWGYEPGTVKDVLINLIKNYGPMKKEEILAKVLSVRFVKPNTVILNLQNPKYFKKDKDGNYYLVKEI